MCEATVSYTKALAEPRNPLRKIPLHYETSLQMLDIRLKSWVIHHHSAIVITTIRKLQLLKEAVCFSKHVVRFIVRPCDDEGKGPINSFQIVKIVAADLSGQIGSRPSWTEGARLLHSLQRHTLHEPVYTLTGAVIECPPLDLQILPVEMRREGDVLLVPESVCLKEF